MFARVFALLPLALLASASHLAARNSNTCSTSGQVCCNQALSQSQAIAQYPGLVSILDLLNGVGATVGVDCVSVVGNACNQQAVCCNNVAMNGLVNVGCNAISL